MSAVQFSESLLIRVLILDSMGMTSQAISAALCRAGFEVVYAGANPSEASAIVQQSGVDIALVSGQLGPNPATAYDIVHKMRDLCSSLRVIVMLRETDRDSTIHAFRAGARGLFCLNSSLDDLMKCITRVHEGQVWINSAGVEHLIEALRTPLQIVSATGVGLLSRREREVVQLVAEGFSNREIADRIGLSENTIKNYLFRIFDKLGVSSRVELIVYAINQPPSVPRQGSQDQQQGSSISAMSRSGRGNHRNRERTPRPSIKAA